MVKEIPLTKGYVALVDDADYEFVSQFKWSALVTKDGRVYARRGVYVDGDWFGIGMHRVIAAAPTGVEVDHWDGNGLNNRRDNLRCCSHRQNMANKRPMRGKQFKGVQKTFDRSFTASIFRDRTNVYLGSYDTASEAARVYDAAAKRIHGEFALTNLPEIDPEADAIAARVLAGGDPPDRSHRMKPRRVITDEQVITIRERYAAGGIKVKDLAAEYGIGVAAVNHVISGRSFNDVGEPIPAERRRELHIANMRKEAA